MQQAETGAQFTEDVRIRARLAVGFDHRPHQLQADVAVGLREVVVLEEGRRWQDDVGVHRRVGHHLLEHHREQVVALKPLDDTALVGHRGGGVAVVDEEHLHRRVGVFEQRPPEVVHVHQARLRFVCPDPRRRDAPRRRVAQRVAATAHPELAAHRGQRQDGRGGAATVAVPFKSPAAPYQRGRRLGVKARHLFELRGIDTGHLGGACEGPPFGPFAQRVDMRRMLVEKCRVGQSVREQKTVECQRHHHVGARFHRQVHIGRPAKLCRARVDNHQLRAAALGLAHVGDEMDAGGVRIDAPQDDQLRVGIVLIDDRRHLPVEAHVGRAGRRRAHRPGQP